jgi:hypothetical protein
MLKANPDRVCTFFAADFEAAVGMELKVPKAAEALQSRLKAAHWGIAPGKYLLRDTARRLIAGVDFHRVFFQTLGLDPWQKGIDEHGTVIKQSLQELGVSRLKRIGFMTQTYLSLGMSHKEMVDLMFGSFFAPSNDLKEILGQPEDCLAQLHGERDKIKFQLIVAPMTTEQCVQNFMQLTNLEAYVEPKLLDTGVKDFKDRLAADCFYVNLDLSRNDAVLSDVTLFLKQSLDLADKITDGAVQKLKSLRIRKDR